MAYRLIYVIGMLLLFYNLTFAGSVGESGFAILKLSTDAKSMAVGGAHVAAAEGAQSVYFNPANLAINKKKDFLFTHSQFLDSINYEYLALAMPLSEKSSWGMSISYMDYGSITQTKTTGTSYTATNNKVDLNDMGIAFSYGRKILPYIGAGITVKYIKEDLGLKSGSAFASDLGFIIAPPALAGRLRIAGVVSNLGTKAKFDVEKTKLPLSFKLGGYYDFELLNLKLYSDIVLPNDNDMGFKLGAEYTFVKLLSIRAGYDSNYDAGSGITAGIGVNLRLLKLDYAYKPSDDLDDSHRISIRFSF